LTTSACLTKNAGLNEAKVLERVKDEDKVFNVLTEAYEDLDDTAVIDPLKVALTAYENAVSTALVALTTEVLIHDKQV